MSSAERDNARQAAAVVPAAQRRIDEWGTVIAWGLYKPGNAERLTVACWNTHCSHSTRPAGASLGVIEATKPRQWRELKAGSG